MDDVDSYPDAGYGPDVRSSSIGAYDHLLLAMGQHPDLGLMCHAKRRTAMWRATLPTTLCTSTFTCAAALIDARLCINTQPFCFSAPKASDHTGYRVVSLVPTEAARVPIMADLDSGSIVSASGMRREDEWSLATGLALTKYDHGEVYRAKDPMQCVFTYGARVCRVNAPRAVRRTGKRRQLFVLIIRDKEKASLGGEDMRNDDVMDDRNAEAPRQTTICEACCYPSNMSTVFFVNATGKGSEDGGGSWWTPSRPPRGLKRNFVAGLRDA
ncbi:hypothetical protein ALC60_06959 [Trachymyrmex zeteki]|uniref:Uncharacterized protein n=1 Tax=Mycetomoellerius zeteki TaxID=64791 RepID=A0A151X113_9HYME|nr:hypothetical protein ALC60_06959 [Trachymyrmex zeteki]